VIRHAAVAPPGFDARRRATGRHYRYLVHEAEFADPLLANLAWTVAGPLDLRAMAAGADALLGEHDFRSFCRRPPDLGPNDPIVRRVVDARWSVVGGAAAGSGVVAGVGVSMSFAGGQGRPVGSAGRSGGPSEAACVAAGPAEPAVAVLGWGRLLRFDVAATSFCHQMVRSMVGVLVAVGLRRWTPADVHWLVARAERSGAPDPAPPHGLSLVHVDYGT